ncbi:Gfo/Idh/MocA family protein [Pontiella agarivorans]|uniref:Gfo/Idh/MocA family oxidoreductase n=1 Tax=Pontiella agarivorans TaxID=3038953 RepID=A0ABU5MWW6_9BACT|nr:Gfo/Idh/MocA family oxidoreductase [Pontiella agarivorans]MDZ8118657.1 Gfo/Idh/MocA family oxidoreductase [Pontiella agarivorans]
MKMTDERKQKGLRWGIIGCGDVTEVKSGPAYQQTDDFELVAVMRRNLEKAQNYAKRHGVPKVFADAEALISDSAVDAVYIATPPDSHREYALKVAAAGKPCCIEKPMAPTHADCVEICAAFETAGVPLFTAFYRRTLPRFVQVKKWLEENRIGPLRHVSWTCCLPASELDRSGEYNWRTDATIAPAGHFDDLACHGLDLLAYYLGDFETVQGVSLNQQDLYSAKDAVAASWVHSTGITGTGTWNFGSAADMEQVEIFGEKGTITFSVFKEAPVRLTCGNEVEELFIAHPQHVQQPHVEALRDDLLNGIPHPSAGRAGIHAAWVMDKILGKIQSTGIFN